MRAWSYIVAVIGTGLLGWYAFEVLRRAVRRMKEWRGGQEAKIAALLEHHPFHVPCEYDAECVNGAVWFCVEHETRLCAGCLKAHDALGECFYVPVARAMRTTAQVEYLRWKLRDRV